MKYLTHKAGGTLGMLVAFVALKDHGMLIPNINPYIQLILMYPAASWGSTAPDLDLSKKMIKGKEIEPLSMAVSGILRLMGAKHRSWQTHCLAITGFLAIIFPMMLEIWGKSVFTEIDFCILRLLIYGMCIGILSHLVLDALTPEGIHIIPDVKVSLVPKMPFFNTDSKWEKLVRIFLIIGIVLMFAYMILTALNFHNLP